MNKDELIKNLHELYRQDEYIQEIFNSAGIKLDNIEDLIEDLENQYWIDTATWGLNIWEKLLDIETNLKNDIENRRSLVEAKWKGDGKADMYLLQVVANSWRNGSVKVDFVDGKIMLTFDGIFGVPSDISTLQSAIDDVKPAHLAIVYAFAYLLIKDIHNAMTINEINNTKLNLFAGGV